MVRKWIWIRKWLAVNLVWSAANVAGTLYIILVLWRHWSGD